MTQPRITPSQVEVAEARRTTLPNGIGLYTLASDDFEVLRISFVFRAGSALQQAPFSASAAANLLSEGSRDMTAHQIAEQLDYYGSWYDVNVDRDYAYINFATLSKFFDPTLAVAEQILLCPAFPEEELRTYAAKRRQRLAVERARPSHGRCSGSGSLTASRRTKRPTTASRATTWRDSTAGSTPPKTASSCAAGASATTS